MSVIISGATTGQGAEVDASSKALRITQYDITGTPVGPRYTYDAASNATTPPATPTDIFVIGGSATKTIRVTRVRLTGVQTTAGINSWFLIRRSTADSGGTAVVIPPVSRDSNAPAATATVTAYTAVPTLGTTVGIVRAGKLMSPAPAGVTNDQIIWDFDDLQTTPMYLRGTAQQLAINFSGSALPGGLSLHSCFTWTEE